jgi:hypothetical protein
MFSYVSVESRIPSDHPIRKLRVLVDTVLKAMDADFAALGALDSAGTTSARVVAAGDLHRSQRTSSNVFGWAKEIGRLCKLPLVGLTNVRAWITWTVAAYNLIRMGSIGGWWESAPT